MNWLARLRMKLGYPAFTDDEYKEAETDNLLRNSAQASQEFDKTNRQSIRAAEIMRRQVNRRNSELATVLRHVKQAHKSAEDAADLLRKIVEGPS